MEAKKTAYDYKRYRITAADGLATTCISLSRVQDLLWVRKAGGLKPLSKLLRSEAARLRREGYTGTLSAAVRRAVQDKLNQT